MKAKIKEHLLSVVTAVIVSILVLSSVAWVLLPILLIAELL